MSLIGGNFSPYRLPADGIPFFCAAYAHETGDVLKLSYVNSTKVANYNGTVGGTIPPYERYDDTSSSSACDGNSNCPTATNGIPCEFWIGTDASATSPQYTLVAGQVNTAPQVFTAGANVNFAVCHKRGFKNVAARRSWHGVFGWLSADLTNTSCATGAEACNSSGDWDSGISVFRPYVATPDQTKYLTLTPSITFDSTTVSQSSTDTVHSVVSGATTVNAQSGEVTTTLETTEVDTTTPTGGSASTTKNIAHGYDSVAGTYGNATSVDYFVGSDPHGGNNPYIGSSLEGAINSFNENICQQIHDANPELVSYTLLPAVTDHNNYTQSTGTIVYNLGTYTETKTMTVGWSRTNTVYSFYFQYSTVYSTIPVDQDNETVTCSGTMTLSDPNTAAALYADIVALLANWPLNDDALYPWRTDGTTNMAPKVSRLEWQAEMSPLTYGVACSLLVPDYTDPIADSSGHAAFSADWVGTWGMRAWFDPNIYAWRFPAGQTNLTAAATGLVKLFDGSVQGAPNPAGYQGYFRFDALDMRACCESNDLGTAIVWYTYGYGQSLPANLPANATQWTNWFEIINKPQFGALLAYLDAGTISSGTSAGTSCEYNGSADAAFWAVKWAEIGETYESINFARPGGYDKFLLDETAVYCFASKSGGVVTLTAVDGTTPATLPFTTSDIVGGACIGGFFAVASVSGATMTLGAQKFSVPSDWTMPSGDQTTAFGRLRFPTAPSLLGRIAITAVADAGSHAPFSTGWTPTYQFTAAQTNFGLAWSSGAATLHETVDIYDQTMTLLASGVTATRISDTKFTVGTSYATAFFVMIHGAPAYQYCDDYPKGDFVYLEWLYDWRTNGEIGRLSGVTDCGGHTPPSGSPTTTNNGYASFTETADALPIIKCHPRVACSSPNGETWPNGKTYAFPTTFSLDALYGSKWQAQVVWSITDPLWQSPHTPCGLNTPESDPAIAWTMDGSAACPADNDATHYYALAPMVEARATVPSGFPALPAGITIGFNAPGSSTDGANPPMPPGYDSATGTPSSVLTPWILAENLCASIAANCRFSYQNWFVGCPTT